ncbi:putative cytochrome b5-like heme/steroid binding domain, cytochrome b5, heme-binding protein [Helianthus annuus]|nr:putative cytochrome b5-like heme/steroid binding domain, cytochrome b5, heme-binding protein [Helianthus annuus]
MGSEAKLLSLHEVSKHDNKNDCWLIISGKVTSSTTFNLFIQLSVCVYDITPFLDDHPGGDEVLLLATKKDATEDFEDVGHSQNARNMLADYYVGDIDINSMPQKGKQPPTGASGSQQAAASSGGSSILMFVLPLLMLVLAYGLYYYYYANHASV